MAQTVFQSIKTQIVNNEVYGNEPKIVISQKSPKYPENIIKWLTKNKIFKVDKVDKNYNGEFQFIVYYKELYTGSDFLNIAYEKAKYEREKYLEKWDKSVHRIAKNDIKRAELQCNNWSAEKDETGYAECPYNEREYEHLEPEDNCVLNAKLRALGFEDYAEFAEYFDGTSADLGEEINRMFAEFVEREQAKGYQF